MATSTKARKAITVTLPLVESKDTGAAKFSGVYSTDADVNVIAYMKRDVFEASGSPKTLTVVVQ